MDTLQWVEGYRGSQAYGPPGMAEKRPEVGYREITNDAPGEWQGEVEVAFMGYERLPLLRKPFFNEVCQFGSRQSCLPLHGGLH